MSTVNLTRPVSAPSETIAAPTQSGRIMSWLIAQVGLDVERTWYQRYGTALAALAVATVVRLIFDPWMQERSAYGFYVIATAFVAWRSGFAPALVTVCVGAVLARYFFEEPRGFFATGDFVSFGMSISLGTVTALLVESLRAMALYNAKLYRMARQADTRKDEFLATLAHELRNPLAPIRNALYLLDALEPGDSNAVQLRGVISNQVEHLIRLVNDLLDVSRITQGKVELRIEHVSLSTVVNTALDMVRPMVQEKEHHIEVSIPQSPIIFDADQVRLTQVLANLLNNAVKYTDPGGRIWLTADVDSGIATIRVRDSGIGIAAEMLPRIFNLFEQAHTGIEQTRGGLGVGLTIVRRLVELHGGTIDAKSLGLGSGSEFTVRLPVAVDVAGDRLAQQPTARNGVRSTSLRVLVVDDVAVTTASTAAVLRLWNHEVETSSDGFNALERARAFRPDVILTDLGLPRMNGYQFAEEVRRIPGLEQVTLIAVSGYGQAVDQKRSLDAGFALHLVKPVSPEELFRVLESLPRKAAAPQ